MTLPLALYFGCEGSPGHHLHEASGRRLWGREGYHDLPWTIGEMDGTLLENGKHPDVYDGRVFRCCGGRSIFWHAFVWWDNSIDRRGGSNSGFYVRGYAAGQPEEAFAFACKAFPAVIDRQRQPLVLQP